MRLDGKVALVTGASRGIGHGIVVRLAAAGCRVVVNHFRQPDLAAAVVGEAKAAGGDCIAVEADVADRDQVASMVRQTADRFGRLDILVNNAAVFPPTTWTEITGDDWDRVMAVNVRGAFNCAVSAHPLLASAKSGRIVNITSTVAFSGPQRLLHYVTSKAALIGFTRALAREVGGEGITVNAVATGKVLTEGLLEWVPQGELDIAEATASRQSQPIKRFGTPADIASAVLFLASDEAAFITGQLINVDGGRYFH
ncbi:MAG TPA: 3-oxoacyl-ACP reductase family protein [Bauldia sp.]|nr:3-oxoacyl-ACP reductase family protein [Bauldia sp.]